MSKPFYEVFPALELDSRMKEQMEQASKTGVPVMRPMFFDYPEDPVCYETGGQYLFGNDLLVAPITRAGQHSKLVYLPEGEWVFCRDHGTYAGGAWYEMSAEISEYIAFAKAGSEVLKIF